jgi:hypothetical protein
MGTHPRSVRSFDWNRRDCEIWLFNEAPNAKNEQGEKKYPKCDLFFQMHHEAIWKNPKNRSDQEHYNWLVSGKTPPVYMQEAYPEVSKAKRYPIEDVLSLIDKVDMVVSGVEKKFKYFSSTPDFALSLAAYLCKKNKVYKRIEVWGIELETESEYIYQRMGFGFWLGYLAALGIELSINGRLFNEPMYGYEGDVAISSIQIESRIAELTSQIGNDKEAYQKEAKTFLGNLSGLLIKNVAEEIQKELNRIIKDNEPAGILDGMINESHRYLEKAKAMEASTNAAVFSPGEFDANRIGFKKQYLEARLETNNLNAQLTMQLKKLLNLKKGSQKRRRALDEFGAMVADLMNKNMIMFHIIGAMQENQYYLDSYKHSLRKAGENS